MKFFIHPDYHSMEAGIRQVPLSFVHDGKVIHSGRNVIKELRIGEMMLVVKRYKRPSFIQRVIYTFFRSSKAERAFKFAGYFRSVGIDTPQEIAYLEVKEKGLFAIGYFISQYTSLPSLMSSLVETPDFNRKLADDFVALVVEMHQKGIFHGDMNLSNVLYNKGKDGNYHFELIDINRTKFASETRERCLKNLTRIVHRKDLYEYIVRRYAQMRGWNEEECLSICLKNLHRFEQKKKVRRWLKTLIS
ncbi:MAG: lipopolysaccharide kinase InaA family protein [Bacteroidaceae bacterium]